MLYLFSVAIWLSFKDTVVEATPELESDVFDEDLFDEDCLIIFFRRINTAIAFLHSNVFMREEFRIDNAFAKTRTWGRVRSFKYIILLTVLLSSNILNATATGYDSPTLSLTFFPTDSFVTISSSITISS